MKPPNASVLPTVSNPPPPYPLNSHHPKAPPIPATQAGQHPSSCTSEDIPNPPTTAHPPPFATLHTFPSTPTFPSISYQWPSSWPPKLSSDAETYICSRAPQQKTHSALMPPCFLLLLRLLRHSTLCQRRTWTMARPANICTWKAEAPPPAPPPPSP